LTNRQPSSANDPMGDTDYKNPISTPAPTIDTVSSRLAELKELMQTKFEATKNIADERDRRYEDRFKAMDEKTTLALASSEKAVTKAEIATEKRFDAVNEFRGSLSDLTSTMIPRAEANARFEALDSKNEDMKKEVGGLRESRSGGEGKDKAGQQHLSLIFSVLAFLGMLTVIFMRGLGK
jgi:hypothetical protein